MPLLVLWVLGACADPPAPIPAAPAEEPAAIAGPGGLLGGDNVGTSPSFGMRGEGPQNGGPRYPGLADLSLDGHGSAQAGYGAPVGVDPIPEWFLDLPAPAPTPPAADAEPGAFVVDGGDIYAAYTYDGLIAVHPAKGAPRSLVKARQLPRDEEIFDLALDATHVWFTSVSRSSDGSHAAYALRRVPKSGGTATVVTRGALGDNGLATKVFVDDAHVWFLRSSAPFVFDLVKLPKAGGAEQTIVRDLAGFSPVAFDGDRFYVYTAGSVAWVPKGGGPVTPIATTDDEVRSIVTSATDVYYTVRDKAGVRLYQAPKAGKARVIASYVAVQPDLFFDRGALYRNEATKGIPSPHRIVTELATGAFTAAEGAPSGQYWRVQDGVAYWREGARFVRTPVR